MTDAPVPRPRGDAELLNDAIAASGLSARRFAVEVLDVDERTVRRWQAGERSIPGPVRMVCRVIVSDPSLTGVFLAA